ncbi:Aste57867_13392 [Aphanomyces stellatus]|uniref:Aste57867_13392 protein n=1 Tax=Aphanomyces stellatus TaxID=120398 RepID=A0A485KXZ5_9STRA|nr:hypothetical protein As57867_013342 [Aphanomyces stellatus]VFT90231.1 Aste57867_13392 [Aphanomyces stellatus]
MHNKMHNTLGGPMSDPTFSPVEPLFWSHHATVDLLHTIYYKCRVAPLQLTDAHKQSNALAFGSCTAGGKAIDAKSSVAMQFQNDRGQTVAATTDASTAMYFATVPTKYYQLQDVRAMGYGYDMTGLLGELYAKCQHAGSAKGFAESIDDDNAFAQHHVVEAVFSAGAVETLHYRREMETLCDQVHLDDAACDAEMEKVMAIRNKECLPAPEPMSFEFKALWRIGENETSRADDVLANVESGTTPIQLPPVYKAIVAKYFPTCGN